MQSSLKGQAETVTKDSEDRRLKDGLRTSRNFDKRRKKKKKRKAETRCKLIHAAASCFK